MSPITMYDVIDRQTKMSSSGKSETRNFYVTNLNDKHQVFSYLRECAANRNIANRNRENITSILSEMDKSSPWYNSCFDFMLNNIAPYYESYLEDINGFTDEQKERYNDVLTRNKICDRIIDNHNKLSKRFNIQESLLYRNLSQDTLTENICTMIDTYNMKPHIKVELMIEEALYCADKRGMNINQSQLVENVVDYFLFSDCKGVNYCDIYDSIRKCKLLDESSLGYINYLTSQNSILYETYGTDKIDELVKKFKNEEEKTPLKFKNLIDVLFRLDTKSAVHGTPQLLRVLKTLMITVTGFVINPYLGIALKIVDKIATMHLDRKDTVKVLEYFKKEQQDVERKIKETDDKQKLKNLEDYNKELLKSIGRLEKLRNDVYTNDEIDKMDNENDDDFDVNFDESCTFDSMYKSGNLAVFNDRNINSIKELLINNIDKYIGTACIKEYVIQDSINIEMYRKSKTIDIGLILLRLMKPVDLDTIIEIVNKYISSNFYNIRLYCNYVDDYLEFKLATNIMHKYDTHDTIPNEIDIFEINKLFEYEEFLKNTTNLLDTVEEHKYDICKYNLDEASKIMEIFKYSSLGSMGCIDMMNEYVYYKENDGDYTSANAINNKIRDIKENYKISDNIDVNTMIESNYILTSILTESDKVDSFMDKLKDIADKGKKLVINSKDVAAKYKNDFMKTTSEINSFKNKMEKFIDGKSTSDKEHMLKSSVMPSFSTILKYGIACAGASIIFGSVIIPAIGLFFLILSKSGLSGGATEEALDRINIEIKILDKKIEEAESEGKMKKYRDLSLMRKSLERNRIRMISKFKGKILISGHNRD